MTTQTVPTAPLPTPFRNTTATQLFQLASSIQRWSDEKAQILQIPTPTKKQSARLRDLNSSLDTYAVYLEELPSEPWIDRANAASAERIS